MPHRKSNLLTNLTKQAAFEYIQSRKRTDGMLASFDPAEHIYLAGLLAEFAEFQVREFECALTGKKGNVL